MLPEPGRAAPLLMPGGDQPPPPLRPMLATPAPEPFDSPDYLFEVKWDGMRAIACVGGGQVRLYSRNLADVTLCYPELHDLPRLVRARRVILDGEIVAFDGYRPSLARLQERMHVGSPASASALAALSPVSYMVFDVLLLDDDELCTRPLTARREVLEKALTDGPLVRRTAAYDGDGIILFKSCAAMGLEGIMAKRKDSRYHPGRRTRDWLKIKLTHTTDAVIGGWTEGTGSRQATMGSLILGVYRDGRLHPVGHTGTGLDEQSLGDITQRLRAIETDTCPFTPCPQTNARAHWVRPLLVCEVRFANLTPGGRLRSPVFLRLRLDLEPSGVDYASLLAAADSSR